MGERMFRMLLALYVTGAPFSGTGFLATKEQPQREDYKVHDERRVKITLPEGYRIDEST
ncbi:hypothetical protein RvY_02042 [Ramazzottius varieornatus]|uniref:Uncharacterized protein n=1 Tax=Ramazzottius varieornatus TaxID=947166 RepID=A0A1D1UM55_RAMVA|nr:hypothetical protein RvY_02042 [Ramazzottius varieornatus]